MLATPDLSATSVGDLEIAADRAIAACGGDAREAVKALLIAIDFLEAEANELRAGRFRPNPLAGSVSFDMSPGAATSMSPVSSRAAKICSR